ncbi:MAG: TldD/PmbA family protein [Alphaproteobacteria bacterium]
MCQNPVVDVDASGRQDTLKSYAHGWFPLLSFEKIEQSLKQAMQGADDGEFFLEKRQSQSLLLDDGKVKDVSSQASQGFGLRSVHDEATFYAHSSEVSADAVGRAAQTLAFKKGEQTSSSLALPPLQRLIGTSLPPETQKQGQTSQEAFEAKVGLLQEMDAYARQLSPLVTQVTLGLSHGWQWICLARLEAEQRFDLRSLGLLTLSVVVSKGGRKEKGTLRVGGNYALEHFLEKETWQGYVQEALRRALLSLEAISAPAGEMPVVLGCGTPGVLLHEAVGHGFEADFNRKGHSIFSDQMGKQVAAKGVTVIDDGSLIWQGLQAPGTLSFDDEGTPTQPTTLIEDGMMVGHLCDRLNGRLMGKASTGNGRRQSYAHMPMPRMTNTYMLAGQACLEDMFQDLKNGIYAVDFHSGQVDIVSGNFVFSAAEAYKIENGTLGQPIKGLTLTGSGPETMKKIRMVGNDLKFDPSAGFCGKAGQSVVVGIGQPSLLVSSLIVGGTNG